MASFCVLISRCLLCVCGIIISVYAYYVETSKSEDTSYQAMCDISSSISCSAVFTSKYGKGFGVMRHIFGEEHFFNQPNSLYGILFFLLQMTGTCFNNKLVLNFLYWNTAFGIILCVYLAYILTFVLHDFCVVCVSTYSLVLILHYLNHVASRKFVKKVKCRSD